MAFQHLGQVVSPTSRESGKREALYRQFKTMS